MKITSLSSGVSLSEGLDGLLAEQKALLARCRELETAALGTLFIKETAPAARWTDENGRRFDLGAEKAYYHRIKDPATGRQSVRKLGPHDEALKERIKLSLLCKKMIPLLEYNIEKLEALKKSAKDPELSELCGKLPQVYSGIGFPAEAFRQ